MRGMIVRVLSGLLLSASVATSSVAQAPKTSIEAIALAIEVGSLAAEFGPKFEEAVEDVGVSLVSGVDVWTNYSEHILSEKFEPGTGMLFDILVVKSDSNGKKYILPPVLVGVGKDADTVALQAELGFTRPKHDTFAGDILFLKKFDEISSLPNGLSSDDKSRAFWIFKDSDGKFSLHVIRDGQGFWANAKRRRIKFLLQKSVLEGFPSIEAVHRRAQQYAELAHVYEQKIRSENISGQVKTLQAEREVAAGQLVDAMTKLGQANDIMDSLRGLQAFQDILTVASIANTAANTAANQAQLDAIKADLQDLTSSINELDAAVGNLQARIDYLTSANAHLSSELNSIESELNLLFQNYLKLGPDVLPVPQKLLP